MADNSMPLLLGGAIPGIDEAPIQVDLNSVDDLFGDADHLSLPPRPPSRRLRRRLDELRSRGCCQGLAWSKGGTVASITPDGQSLELRYLRAKPDDASWELSEPKLIAPWPTHLNGGPILHLSWGPANSELAAIDAVGRVLLMSFNNDLNRPMVSRRWDTDPVDDSHTIVGTYWLNQLPANTRFHPTYSPAVKSPKGADYTFENSGVPAMGPNHPNPSKSAFICVTTNGLLKMFWSQNSHKSEETTLELESATSADDLITHAAACSDKTRSIYIAMATTSKQLRVVQVAIAFNASKPENSQNAPQAAPVLTPSFGKRHVAVTSWFQTGMCASPLDASMFKISHVEMLPAVFDFQSKQWSPIVVVTVRSFMPEANSPYNQEVQSIIDRWELLTDQKQTVHPAFERSGARRNSAGSAPPATARLKMLESIVVNKIVLGVNVLSFGKVISFYYNDGAVDYRDRFTMQELYRSANLDRIHSILEAGFSQSGEAACLQMAFSPSNCSLVQMYEGSQIRWHNLSYTLEDQATISDNHMSAVIASCAMSTAAAIIHNSNFDDILAVARKFPRRDQIAVKWVTDLVQIMRITVDYSEDLPHDHLIRNQQLQLCFSIFNHLGWNGEYNARHFRSRLFTLALSLRNVVILITLASSAPSAVRAASSPLDEPEVVNALAGCARWSIDFLGWLCSALIGLLDDAKFMSFLPPANQPQQLVNMTKYLHSKNEIALHLILCSSTRNLISAVCRRIGLLDSYASRALAWYSGRGDVSEASSPRHAALHAAYRKVHRYTSSAYIKADEFEKFIAVLAADIRTAYGTSLGPLAEREAQKVAKNPPTPNQNSNAPKPQDRIKEARQHSELNMLLVHPPPPSFLPVITKLFRQDLTNFRTKIDVPKLYFADYRILEIVDTPEALANRKKAGKRVDMLRRVEISRPGEFPWRQCSRCGNAMEEITSTHHKPGMIFLLAQQRTCCCGGRLAILP
ncbi:RNA polymerase II mediator complex subunit Sin4 [Astrocystis sublimbata]|nr:RNA polymerase II mediator complex subunit Sin4 [Astrocystis sublimbata]